MKAEELKEYILKVDIIDFLKYTGNKIIFSDDGVKAYCPFHAEGKDETLIIDKINKKVACEWCEFEGNIAEYITKLFKFQNGGAVEYIHKYFESKKPKEKHTIINMNKHEIELMIEDRLYLITQFNLRRLHDFNMTIKLQSSDKFCIAEVNLTKARSREEFVRQAKDLLFISEDIIRDDLMTIMEAIEKLQRETIRKIDEERESNKKVFTMTESEENKAIELLTTKDIFNDDLLKDMERLGYVGDELGKMILYLAGTSRILNKPISVLSVANSSAGKSFAQDMILSLFPDDEVFIHTRITPKSLSHYKLYELMNKIFCIDELVGIEEEGAALVRSFMSRGKLSSAYPVIDRLTGKIETVYKEVIGPAAFFTSTTHEEAIDDETRNRFLILPVDESAEQTLRVMKSLIYQNTREGIITGREKEFIQRKYKVIQKALRKLSVVIPDDLSKYITFNNERISFKRKFNYYLSMIYSIALHRQFQKKIYTDKDKSGKEYNFIYVTKNDIISANDIITKLFGKTLGELNPVNEKCLRDIENYCKKHSEGTDLKYTDVLFTRKDIRDMHGWEHRPLRRAFEQLHEMEYIVRSFGKDRARFYYKLNIDNDSLNLGVKLNVWYPGK